jgi:hypothetical protein
MADGVSFLGDQFEGSHLLGQSEGFHQTKERVQRTADHTDGIVAECKPKS